MPARPRKLTQTRLRQLIDEATVDCYREDEQLTGFLTSIESNMPCPFPARVIGEPVSVTGFQWAEGCLPVLYAVCEYKGRRYPIELTSLQWGSPKPEGYEWIEAYRAWRTGAY